ncbi:HAD-IA family hydrolase [Deinococcus maricopensis]|uniref:HAD-superfamily hydrolase, subfamily IA, variant 3 n=1 Tax=Deinococcus maricopensis (strain DSM 21211 / LMG 22137 / NRRL B-23946 / LB-34) TaxID=709986 RepID=E8UAK1_DEIML|nr:HAD-IA family hydrolase [Deinococcus maricopensis]ADV68090.1 HAD-superfamily hydrolase, subfamily IA, variant 3 [Deinococcus maricopensis DSM 21211]
MTIRVIFWDIGGVLLTNGWDREQRARVVEQFGLDAETFDARHRLIAPELEAGRVTLDDYLAQTVFGGGAAPCSADAFRAAMFAQSQPHADTLTLARALAGAGARMYALNNESRELNAHRIGTFALDAFLLGFFSSCYLGLTKPGLSIFRVALDLAHVRADEAVMIDDRAQNIEAARTVGLHGIVHTGADATLAALRTLGVPAALALP